jgi:DNA-binding response OmpR family regulator
MKILLVEDDQFFEKFYAHKLQEQGFEVDMAVDGVEGMQKMVQNKPDLILLDIIMPNKDGFEVLKEKGASPALKNIPVLVFSTLGQDQDVQKAKELGATDYVNKSFFDFEKLLAKINSLLPSATKDTAHANS